MNTITKHQDQMRKMIGMKMLFRKSIINTLILKIGINKSSKSAAFLFYTEFTLNISYN